MPDLPPRVTVCRTRFYVIRSRALRVGRSPAFGVLDLPQRAIFIARTIDGRRTTRQEKFDTLIHEFTHIALIRARGLKLTEEQLCWWLGREVARAICRNRKVIAYILKG